MQNPADLLRAESFYAIIIKKVYHNTRIDNEVLSGTGGRAMIDVKLLTLLKVYETGNYTRAAEQLALTQPAVSQHIKAIEKALGHSRHHVVLVIPYAQGGLVDTLHSGAKVLRTDYTGEGIEMEVILDDILYGRLKNYVCREC
jgi:hypothetical protein